jgi:alpha-tubulin suppressor-like RCC1 family protein
MWGRTHDSSNIIFLARWGTTLPNLMRAINTIMSVTPFGLSQDLMLPSIHNEGGARVRQVECSAGFTIVLTRSGRVLSYGNNKYGKLGVGHLNADSDWHLLEGEIGLHRIEKVAAGMNHVCALTEHGALFTWGRCDRGQLGHGTNLQDVHDPRPIQLAGSKVVDVSAGTAQTCAVLEDGSVYVWGKYHSKVPRVNSLLGHEYGYFCDQLLPRKVVIDAKIVHCVSNSHQTALLDSDGKIYVLGLKSQASVDQEYRNLSQEELLQIQNEPLWKQREIRQTESRNRMVHDPVPVTGEVLEGREIVKLASGIDHLYAICSDGSMVQFAVGETEAKEFPLSKGLHVLDYSEGWFHNHFIVQN